MTAVKPVRWTILLAAILPAIGAAPPGKKADYSSWNAKWFASCQGEKFVVNVVVGTPRSAGAHSFHATFLPGGGVCSIGSDAPVERVVFLDGTLSNGKISGTIFLCTHSQELVDANNLPAVFSRHFDASYNPEDANITDTQYKSEYYKRSDSATKDSRTSSETPSSKGPYQRDEPNDPEGAFEMHIFRGPPFDQTTPNQTNPQSTPPSSSLGSKAKQTVDDVVHQGTHDWMNSLRRMLGADPI